MEEQGGAVLSVVVPTYNERPNLRTLFEEFQRVRGSLPNRFEILVVDDNSPDGTAKEALTVGRQLKLPVRVLSRNHSRSLGDAISEGLSAAEGELACVMDADLSHPPSILPEMLERLNGFDGVVASRYTAGGSISNWPLHRRLVSRIATGVARSIIDTPCTDPLSGYFLFRKTLLEGLRLTGVAGKPLLEILEQARPAVYEVPYKFQNRHVGKSKLGARQILMYLRLMLSLYLRRTKESREARSSSAQPAELIRTH